ncbi:MAG: glycogen debranching enzyme family protein [Chloroflexi bacterium]|nr:glycogen debranching enzyme family protein [Chloroflexota bacterium]
MDMPDTREWLTTNGLGGYASGTVVGANTRRYHGLLVAALEPPGRRTVLLSRIDETVTVGGDVYDLATSFWSSGATAPAGYHHLARFQAAPIPTWEYRVGLGRLVKRVACLPGRNAVAIGYRLEGGPPVRLELKLLANHRDFHGDTHGHPDWQFRQDLLADGSGLQVAAWDGATPWHLAWSEGAEYRSAGDWYWGYRYPEEEARGLPSIEDAYCVGILTARLQAGDRLDVVASVGAGPSGPAPTADDLAEEYERRRRRLVVQAGLPESAEALALVAAADQFLVRRESTAGATVIAGYHWFGDWGRDTMIALPGLTLATRRFDVAAEVLRTFARYVDRGMLPNRFPDGGEAPEYNTVDATLWWFQALEAYRRASGDDDLAREQFPLLAEVIDWHVRGTRHRIKLDPADGLLLAGEPGVQLTWMDAKIGDWVVTPRVGKPVEINALWLNALEVMAELAERFGQSPARYRDLAEQARRGMQRFWSPTQGYLYDVIGPDGIGDASLRPNQLFALSLPHRAFRWKQEAAVLAVVRDHLLTPYGLRTLAPGHPAYTGRYVGDAYHRDAVYHQGTVWPWLLGAYVDALLNVHGPTPETLTEVRDLLQPLPRHLEQDACLGSVSEIFDGDAPHTPRGCVAQAWSVAELLRIYALVERAEQPSVSTVGSAFALTAR